MCESPKYETTITKLLKLINKFSKLAETHQYTKMSHVFIHNELSEKGN